MKKIVMLICLVLVLVGCDVSLTKESSQLYFAKMDEGNQLLSNDDVEGALEVFLEAKEYADGDDVVLNNISMAYNQLGEYELSKKYILEAIAIGKKESVEYVNAGNASLGLDDYDDAIEYYELSLELNDEEFYSYYGLGQVYYELGEYDLSIDALKSAIELNKDYDAYLSVVDALMMNDDYDDALLYANKAIKIYPYDYDIYDYKGKILEVVKNESEVLEYYKEIDRKFSFEEGVHLNTAWYYYNAGKYDKCAEYLLSIIKRYDDFDTYFLLTHALKNSFQYELALNYADTLETIEPDNYKCNNTKGLIYDDQGYYLEAIPYFLKASEQTDEMQPSINVVTNYFKAKRYSKAIEFGLNELEKYGDDIDILRYVAYSYYHKSDYEMTIQFYKRILALDLEAYDMYYELAESYFYLDELELALENIDTYLDYDPNNYDAMYIKEMIGYKDEHSDDVLVKLFEEYYLYDYEQVEGDVSIDTLNDEEIRVLLENIKQSDDPFTYMIYGEDYDYQTTTLETLAKVDVTEHVVYLNIPFFDQTTDNLFIEAIDDIEDSENKVLLLDLRQNGGGNTKSANNILDVLLPEVVTSQIIYKDGYTDSYYSDASMTQFKHIYVVVDEYTASVAELITLGLKTYLEDVTIIGEQTFGKGVGQHVYDDSINNRLYYIVNHYWNVRQTNIDGVGIIPDIKVKASNINDYLKELVEELEAKWKTG
ncbi:MAG: tetratricopeptide repeat protein [Clostridiales bacterium]|nr:tetratricopeptide repeat protein [Clostridiales bacterium]